MTQYPPQHSQSGHYGNRPRADEYNANRGWQQDDNWQRRDIDRDRGESSRGTPDYYAQQERYQGWQQPDAQRGRESWQQEDYRGGQQGSNYGGMGRWPRNEDRENYGQQDYSFGESGRGQYAGQRGYGQDFSQQGRSSFGYSGGYGDEYRRPENVGGRSAGNAYGQPFGQGGGQYQPGGYSGQQNYRQAGGQNPYAQQGLGQSNQGSQGSWAQGSQGGYGQQDFASGGMGAGRSQASRPDYRGRSPRGYSRSDERIKEDICERLTEDPYIDASEITIEVAAGVVTLEGTVDDRSQKHRAEDMVDSISGVKDVHNRLSVSRTGGDGGGAQSGMQGRSGSTGQGQATQGQTAQGQTGQSGQAGQSGLSGTADQSGQNKSTPTRKQ